jgi:hypothetical protein
LKTTTDTRERERERERERNNPSHCRSESHNSQTKEYKSHITLFYNNNEQFFNNLLGPSPSHQLWPENIELYVTNSMHPSGNWILEFFMASPTRSKVGN